MPLLLGGCDLLGLETARSLAARKEAEARAIGSACRHAMRAIEDCYVLNPRFARASIHAGWRDMDEYMRENRIEGIAPVVARPVRQAQAASGAGGGAGAGEEILVDSAAPEPPVAVEMPTQSSQPSRSTH